jgi:6-phosphofructokinase 1
MSHDDSALPPLTAEALRTKDLGERRFLSPLAQHDLPRGFVPDGAVLPLDIEVQPGRTRREDLFFEKAGPREHIYFDPAQVRAAIVTAGGLCPGLNNVIRSIVLQLHYGYGVRDVLGIRYGYAGMNPSGGHPPIPMTLETVADIHRMGGTILGSSRAQIVPAIAVDFLQNRGIKILFAIGGDGTLRGAHAIHLEAVKRGYPLAVIGVPKTIDNDIPFVWRSFGFFTAIEKSREIIDAAHGEAKSHLNGIGLVRLMGREAGFVAAGATLASQEVNFTLIPEIPFSIGSFVQAVRERLQQRHHAVIVVAEGAGQDLIPDADLRYAPTSRRGGFKNVGLYLRDMISDHCRAHGVPVDIKYLDPTYYVRSAPANAEDALLCDQLARHAVHAGMAGKTDTLIGLWYNINTHVPIELVASRRKRIAESNEIWRSVLQATGQAPHYR